MSDLRDYNRIMNRLGDVRSDSKFAVKLSFADRCAVLGLLQSRVNRRLVGAVFEVSRATLNLIRNPNSQNYRDVRKEYADLGHERFCVRYITDAILERIEIAKKDPTIMELVNMSDDEVKAKEWSPAKPNKNSNKYAGTHKLAHPLFKTFETIEVVWTDDGWTVRFPEGHPFADPEQPFAEQEYQNTSKQALDLYTKNQGLEVVE